MRPTRFTRLAVLGSAAILGLLLLSSEMMTAEEPFSTTVGKVTVGDVKSTDKLEVPYITWGGDVATFLANGGKGDTKADSIFGKQGLKLNLVAGDDFVAQVKNYMEGKSPFLRGTMSMLGQASEVLGSDPRTKPVVFLQLTWSQGDHMVSRPTCKTLNDLKGKKIALQKGGPHLGMLDDILRTAKIDWKDIKVVWTDDVTGDKGPAAVFKKDPSVDACFVISPDMAGLTGGLDSVGTGAEGTVKDAKVLVSTATMSRSIADVYAVRKDFFDKNKELVEKFAAGYLKGCEELVDLKKKAKEKDKDAQAKYRNILKMTQDIYGKEVIPGEVDADGLISDAIFVGLPGNVSFFTDKTNLAGFAVKEKGALDLAVGQGYAKVRSDLVDAGLDYDKIKQVGGLSAEIKSAAKPAPIIAPGAEDKVFAGADQDKNTIFFFTINFDANDPTFKPEQYEKDFQRAVEQASLFGRGVVAIRGHADPTKALREFVSAGKEKGMIRVTGSGANSEYFLVKDGTKLDLTDTKKIVALIEKENWAGATDNPKATVKAALDLSQARAREVREAVLKYAEKQKLRLDESQMKFVGVGIVEPVIGKPKSPEEAAKNRRVEFRILKVSPELITQKDFDF